LLPVAGCGRYWRGQATLGPTSFATWPGGDRDLEARQEAGGHFMKLFIFITLDGKILKILWTPRNFTRLLLLIEKNCLM
jgi:hypothetical protein